MIGRKSLKNIFLFICAAVILLNVLIYIRTTSKSDTLINTVRLNLANLDEKIDWHDYKLILAERFQTGPGENGKPYVLTDPVEIEINKKGLLEEGFATVVSEKVSLNRSMPDERPAGCKDKKYLKNLPTASVVITFYNEHWTLLLRCLHSVFNRTPPELLHEIILINDKSTASAIVERIKSYIETHFDKRLKLFENVERSGLIVSRVEGAKKATGEVIVFLDSHMEVNINWLPPLLEPIQLNPKTATAPIVNGMDPRTLRYDGMYASRGGFDWSMTFKWLPLRKQDLLKPAEPHEYIAMPGGAYAIRKDFFFELGGYDEGMRVWNGENYELSFKIWLCGGRLLQAPCSNVAHMSKTRSKYREENYGFDYSTRNLKRMAEVWMDEYKELVYRNNPKQFSIDAGDLSKQFELKKRLKCKPFKFFIEEVAPDLVDRYPISDRGDFANGSIFSETNPNLCVTIVKSNEPLELAACSSNKEKPELKQDFILTWHRMIRQNEGLFSWNCIDLHKMTMFSCHFGFGNQLWKYDPSTRQVINPPSNSCMTADIPNLKVISSPCNVNDPQQRFNWGYVNAEACANWDTFGIQLP